MSTWNPWRGCHKKSEGCLHCYIHRADAGKGIDTDRIIKTDEFYKPIEKDAKRKDRIKSGQVVFLCFNSDFLIEEADEWRKEAWKMIKQRDDLHFLFLTKRIERFTIGLPEDWGEGYPNVTVCCTIENQVRADERLKVFKTLPIRHKLIVVQPMLEKIDIASYLDSSIECVVAGGESGKDVRPLDYAWVLDLRRQCMENNVSFEFRQIGSIFIKDQTIYRVQKQFLGAQARKANINYKADPASSVD